jgi:hypothetical protein
MVAYTGTLTSSATQLGNSTADLSIVTGRFTFTAATLATTDTFSIDLFTQNGITVPVYVFGFRIFSTTTTPASLVATIGNSDNAAGFITTKALTETGQMVRCGDGALIGTRINNKTVTITVTTSAGAAYTGDLILEFLVKPAQS